MTVLRALGEIAFTGVTVFLAVFLGSFLAAYVVADMAGLL